MKYSDFPVPQATFQPDSIDIKRARKKAAREAMICVSWEDGIVIDFMMSCILWGCYVLVCELLLHTYCGRSKTKNGFHQIFLLNLKDK